MIFILVIIGLIYVYALKPILKATLLKLENNTMNIGPCCSLFQQYLWQHRKNTDQADGWLHS